MSKETKSTTDEGQFWFCTNETCLLFRDVPIGNDKHCAKCGYAKNGDRYVVYREPLPPRKKEAPESTECPDCFEPFDSKKCGACPFCYVQAAKKKKLDSVFSEEMNKMDVVIKDMTKSRDMTGELLEKTRMEKAKMLQEKYPLVYRVRWIDKAHPDPFSRDFVDETHAKRVYRNANDNSKIHMSLDPVYTGGFSVDQLLALNLTQAE